MDEFSSNFAQVLFSGFKHPLFHQEKPPSETGVFFCLVSGLLLAVAALEALLEFFHATFGVQEALLTGPERVYAAPNVNGDFGLGRVRFHHDFAAVNDFAWDHLRMNVFFHEGS
jgi:hypothetical protein